MHKDGQNQIVIRFNRDWYHIGDLIQTFQDSSQIVCNSIQHQLLPNLYSPISFNYYSHSRLPLCPKLPNVYNDVNGDGSRDTSEPIVNAITSAK